VERNGDVDHYAFTVWNIDGSLQHESREGKCDATGSIVPSTSVHVHLYVLVPLQSESWMGFHAAGASTIASLILNFQWRILFKIAVPIGIQFFDDFECSAYINDIV
jgi:hypothetical protein